MQEKKQASNIPHPTIKDEDDELERHENPMARRASISSVGAASRASSLGSVDPKNEAKLNRAARMVMFTKWFTAISFSLAFGSLFLFIWGTANHSAHWTEEENIWFDVLNLLITIVFGIEIAVRYMVLKKGFWQSCWNVFDILLFISCCLETLIAFLIRVQFVYTSWRLVILFARYFIQLLRLLCILRHQRQLVLGVTAARDTEIDIENYDPEQLEIELTNLSNIPMPTLPRVTRSNSTAGILPSHAQPPLPLSSPASTNTESVTPVPPLPPQKEYNSFSPVNTREY